MFEKPSATLPVTLTKSALWSTRPLPSCTPSRRSHPTLIVAGLRIVGRSDETVRYPSSTRPRFTSPSVVSTPRRSTLSVFPRRTPTRPTVPTLVITRATPWVVGFGLKSSTATSPEPGRAFWIQLPELFHDPLDEPQK